MMNAIVSTSSRMFFRWFLRLAPALAVLSAALLLSGGGAADAQDTLPPIADIRDLAIELRVTPTGNRALSALMQNKSTLPMRNVQVRFTTDPPAALGKLENSQAYVLGGQYDATSGIWTIPELLPGSRGKASWYFGVSETPGYSEVVKVSAQIIGSVPAEDVLRFDNNQAELWIYMSSSTGVWNAVSNTRISTEVVNRSPTQGENYVFAVNANEITSATESETLRTRYIDKDVVVKVALSEGLDFAEGESATATSGTYFSWISPTAGAWRLGSGARVTGQLKIPVQLSADAGAAPPLNRRCLTAQIVVSRPPARTGEGGSVPRALGQENLWFSSMVTRK